MKFILVISFQILCAGCLAQLKSLSGSVIDSTGQPLANVFITLFSNSDSLSAKTNELGIFSFKNTISNKFSIRISMVEYEDYRENFLLDTALKESVILDPVQLRISVKELRGVILNRLNPVTVKEDTIEYRADAYKVRDGSVVEDILKKLPGLTVSKDGIVTAQGKEIQRVRVNGKDYFGGDVITATQNLPANIIENIQVIEDYGEKSNATGLKSGDAEKILNINIKKGKNKGTFGNATIVAGTRGRYLANVSANNFKEDKQLSMLASLNNTNANSFEFSGGSGRSNNSGINEYGGNGISKLASIGLNYRRNWGKKVISYGSYSYGARVNNTIGTSYQQEFNAENINLIRNKNQFYANSNNHRFTVNLEYKSDTSNYLKVSTYISSAASANNSESYSEYSRPQYFTQSNALTDDASRAPTFGSDLFYMHRFRKPKRNFNITGSINHTVREMERNVENDFYNFDSSFSMPLSSYLLQNQLVENSIHNTSANLRFSFTESLGKFHALEASYAWNNSRFETVRDVKDVDQMTGEKVKNVSQSNDYNYQFITNRIGLSLYSNKKKYNYFIGFSAQPSLLTGRDVRRNITTANTNFNWVPSARISYKFSPGNSLSATYNGTSREPGFAQLQPISDSSNIKYIITGNPNLQPEFTNRFQVQYNRVGLLNGSSFFTNASFEKTQNKIVSSRINDTNGTGRTITYLNTDGFYGFSSSTTFTRPLANKKYIVSFNTTAGFDNNISFTDQQKNTGHNWYVRPGLSLRIDYPDLIDVSIGTSYSYNKNLTNYPMHTYSTEVETFNFGINGKNYFLKDWTFGYDLTRKIYTGYLASFNANPTLLNLFVERRFLKNNKALMRLQGFDLFDQNTGITRNINGTTIVDQQNNRLSRYFLFSFNYRIQKFTK